MKVLVYTNKAKDSSYKYTKILFDLLLKNGIEGVTLEDSQLKNKINADALFVVGGDGTILDLTEFSSTNNIPVIGINAGKVGFLTEFETSEIEEAVNLFKESQLKSDSRIIISAQYKDKIFYALNDVVVQRVYTEERGVHITNLDVSIEDNKMDRISGDGVIVCTPTGSTAYSLSASGAILTPDINAFSITPICAHSLHHRPVIYSADNVCKIHMLKGSLAGLFIDGNFIGMLDDDDVLSISKSQNPIVFLRRKDSDFFDTLLKKLNSKRLKNV